MCNDFVCNRRVLFNCYSNITVLLVFVRASRSFLVKFPSINDEILGSQKKFQRAYGTDPREGWDPAENCTYSAYS